MGRGPGGLEPCRLTVESRRYGRLVFIGFTDYQLCLRAERLGIRVLYAPVGERTACLVREEDAGLVCGEAGVEPNGPGNPAGGGGVDAAVGATSPVSAQPAGYNHAAVDAVPAAAASTMESATTSTRATVEDQALFERILADVAMTRKGRRRATPLSVSLSRDIVAIVDELAEQLGVNTSRLVDALIRFALVKLGYMKPPE